MAFVDLASNEMVTFTNAATGGFTLNAGQSNVTSNECMTKTQALTKYNLSASAMSSYASNQLVPKSGWVSNGGSTTNVIITACGTNANSSKAVLLYAYSAIAVNTNVSVTIRWTGALGSIKTGTVIIASGDSCSNAVVNADFVNEAFASLQILSILPASSSTQTYVSGSVSGGSCVSCA